MPTRSGTAASSQASVSAASSLAGHQADLNHNLELQASPGPTPELPSYHHGCFSLCPPRRVPSVTSPTMDAGKWYNRNALLGQSSGSSLAVLTGMQ